MSKASKIFLTVSILAVVVVVVQPSNPCTSAMIKNLQGHL